MSESEAQTASHIAVVQPEGWKRPRGYANGMAAQGTTFVAGQIGWDAEENFHSDDLVDQFLKRSRTSKPWCWPGEKWRHRAADDVRD